MNMKTMVAVLAACAATAVLAEEETQESAPAAKTAVKSTSFTTLPLCRRIEGRASVRKPGGEWTEAEEGKFYPFGTSYRAEAGGSLVLAFGIDSTATVADGSEFGTRAEAIGVTSRTIVLAKGTVDLKLPDNLPEGMFFVTAPGFLVKNPAGESKFVYEDKGDGDRVTVRCVTGSLGIEGRHFSIPAMHSADEVVIRTSHDQLSTFLYGTSGDYVAEIDQGLRRKDEIDDDGQIKSGVEKGKLAWHLSPKTKVIINRAVPAVGERMSVHTMAFDAAGERKSECYFCEGRSEVNSGEMVQKAKVSEEDLAKRAAEVTETTAATDEESSDENASSEEE